MQWAAVLLRAHLLQSVYMLIRVWFALAASLCLNGELRLVAISFVHAWWAVCCRLLSGLYWTGSGHGRVCAGMVRSGTVEVIKLQVNIW